MRVLRLYFFFFNDTATTEIYTLSLHDALPILDEERRWYRYHQLFAEMMRSRLLADTSIVEVRVLYQRASAWFERQELDRKSTRLNSSHANISYAVFCLKKKKRR